MCHNAPNESVNFAAEFTITLDKPKINYLVLMSTCTITYKECPENVVRNVQRTVAVIVAEADDAVSFIRAEWKEHRRHRAVDETVTTIRPQQQQQQQLWQN